MHHRKLLSSSSAAVFSRTCFYFGVPSDGGYWHVVAGRIEVGEEAKEAANRELREETGLVTSLGDPQEVIEYTKDGLAAATSRAGVGVHVTCFTAVAPDSWQPILNEEHDAYEWRPYEEAAVCVAMACNGRSASATCRSPEVRSVVRHCSGNEA